MVVSIDTEKCIGCGVCVQIDPDVFSLDDARGVAKVIREEDNDLVEVAIDSCPVSCISMED